jgi:hypothetical protein
MSFSSSKLDKGTGNKPKTGGYVMKTIVGLMLVSMLMIVVAVPAYAVEVIQVFDCEMDEDATDDAIMALAMEWVKAAKKMKGGEHLEVTMHQPIVGEMGKKDFIFLLKAPSLEEWAVFTDGYTDSVLEEIDDKLEELCDCPDSALWDIEKVE